MRDVATATAGLFVSSLASGQVLLEVGDLPGGGVGTVPRAISADGSVVVGDVDTGGFGIGLEGFRWTRDTGIVGIGDLPGGPDFTRAFGVSGDGSVIAGTGRGLLPGLEMTRWVGGGPPTPLGFLPGGGQTGALAISNDGLVLVGEAVNPDGRPEAVFWTELGGFVRLGDFPGPVGDPNGFVSQALAVNRDGSVIVGRGRSERDFEAFRWTAATGLQDLGLMPDGNLTVRANAVTPDGSVVVGYANVAGGGRQAFRWTSADGLVSLGDLGDPANSVFSEAFDVTADASMIVGHGSPDSGPNTGFVWTQADGMRSIASFLSNEFGIDVTGWTFDVVFAVSDDGTVLTGAGANPNGEAVGWVAILTGDDCPADVNGDGELTPADFNAWVIAFNNQLDSCDQNGDGLCDPADFNAWILNFNAGC
ncbi:MAG: GC-type dockerin domain-anchored protein [Planctomycetota bacterium]